MLAVEKLDTLVFDIQDVGCRFYTYIWTLWDVMIALPGTAIPRLVVLDRPNPIGAEEAAVQGPVLEPAFSSFIGRYAIPLRHAMTVGELASLFFSAQQQQQQKQKQQKQKEKEKEEEEEEEGPWRLAHTYNVCVVKMKNYERSMWFADTHVPWVPPSPNMPTVNTATVYPGIGILEGTNLSEGRGTTTPFNLFGAGFFNYTFVDLLRKATACPSSSRKRLP